MDEATFRALLDERGVLREPSLAFLDGPRLLVFAQQTDGRIDVARFAGQARRFFDVELGLTVDKSYGDVVPVIDAARVVVAPRRADRVTTRSASPPLGGARAMGLRPAEPGDHELAREAEARGGATGMGLLAQRCAYVYAIATEGEDDAIALTLAAIVASVVLGPIYAPERGAIFGVKTARLTLEKWAARS